MENIINQQSNNGKKVLTIKDALNLLPPDVQNIISSSAGDEVDLDIFEKYKIDALNKVKIFVVILNICLKKRSLDNLEEELGKIVDFNADKEKIKSLAIDIAGKRLLALNDWLEGKVTTYIEKLGGDLDSFKGWVEQYKKRVEEENAQLDILLGKKEYIPEKILKKIEEPEVSNLKIDFTHFTNVLQDLEKIFEELIGDVLDSNVDELRLFLNFKILEALIKDENFKKNLQNALLRNNQKISSQPILPSKSKTDSMLEEKSGNEEDNVEGDKDASPNNLLEPTVANWIKNFISEVGVEEYNKIKITEYLVENKNIRNLNQRELDSVRRLLKVFINLVFFPEPFRDIEIEEWEIIPPKIIKSSVEEILSETNDLKRMEDLKPADEGVPQKEFLSSKVKQSYAFSLAEQELIKQDENDIKRLAKGNIILIGKELSKALQMKNRPRTIAALRIAVKNNLLIGWAKKNITYEAEEKEIAEFKDLEGKILTKEQFENNVILIKFLQKILQEKLGLNENESAKIGIHLYNLFKKLGRDVGYLAYYDEADERFKWHKIG